MSDKKTMLITARGQQAELIAEQKGPRVGEVFSDVANVKLVGSDSLYSIRVSIPAEQEEELKSLANKRGYVAERDYTLRADI